ncbi:unannotated protein [freshwater metagenome]|uniref:Unannotated protein n=1 Tax=freshwater metagenome TaxID=449393 RepID=A0A6J6Y6I0_9ZZZZ
MHTDPRPSRLSVPSSFTSAQSPGMLQRCPSIILKVAALFTSSL